MPMDRSLVFKALRMAAPVIRYSGLPFVIRHILQSRRVTIGYYHDINADTLDRHLTELGKSFNLIGLRDYVDALGSGTLDVLPRRALVITIDDGRAGNRALLETFQRHSVVPTIFLCSGIVGTDARFWWTILDDPAEAERLKLVPDDARIRRLAAFGYKDGSAVPADGSTKRSALSREEIEQMRGSIDFQAHTVFHPILSRCGDERARTEIFDSKRQLEDDFGFDIYALAYPNGRRLDFTEREAALASECGYRCALTTEGGLNGADAHPFKLKRLSLGDESGPSEAVVRASGIYAFLQRTFVPD